MSRRFDGRTKGEFKKDIKFTTQVESYFFERVLAVAKQTKGIWVSNPTDNGVDNSGEYLAKGNTAGADYRVDLRYKHLNEKQHPLEIKWVPTAGKFTLKENDLKASCPATPRAPWPLHPLRDRAHGASADLDVRTASHLIPEKPMIRVFRALPMVRPFVR